jgi:hypothetical protein
MQTPPWRKACVCPAHAPLCNLTDCQLPAAVEIRRSVRLRWYERLGGLLIPWRWR